MLLQLFQVDSFTNELFKGNPACVVPLTEWLSHDLLQKIAKENGVSETAFVIPRDQHFDLRWFTPEIEMDLCGHATLATAHILRTQLKYQRDSFVFHSNSGELIVTVNGNTYELDFPSRKPVAAELTDRLKRALPKTPKEVLKARDFVLVYETEEDVKNVVPDRETLNYVNPDPGGIIVTAPGKNADFVSRFYVPGSSIFEDPVTGSAHCSLIPYWSEKLGKDEMQALQLSERGGILFCKNKGSRVLISGQARTYSAGTCFVDE